MTRDPRVDPQPGDVVRVPDLYGGLIEREVIVVVGDRILWMERGVECWQSTAVWRCYCATATIVKTAEEGGMDEQGRVHNGP